MSREVVSRARGDRHLRHAAFLLVVAAAAALTGSTAGATIVIRADRGGLITDYAERFLSIRGTGEQVVIDGPCLSACTLVIGMLPRDRICATPKAVLGFHAAWLPTRNGGRVNSVLASQAMMEVYPPDLRSWIARRGGLTAKMIYLQGRDLAAIVPPCGTSVNASVRAPREPHVVRRTRLAPRR
jgi:hypothetical protein